MLQFIQLPKIHLKKPCDKAIMKKLNLNICVYPAHCYHPPSHPQPVLKSSFVTPMVFHKLNEINYFHILQTLHRVCNSPCLPTRVQLTQFICVANEPALAMLCSLRGLLMPCSEQENPAEEWSKASFSGRQMLSKQRKRNSNNCLLLRSLLAFIIFGVCWLALMKPHVIFI